MIQGCINCEKVLSKKGLKNSLCITCFNKQRVGAKNPSWKGGKSKQKVSNSKFSGPPKQRIGDKNPMFGRKHSDSTKRKIRELHMAEKNWNWKGDNVGYQALHNWIRLRIQKPILCVNCNEKPPYDLANISQKYKRDINDWEWLCRRCHIRKDGRNKKGYKRVTIEIRGE